MSQLHIRYRHGLGAQAAKARVQEFEKEISDRYGISLAWNGHRASMDGRGITGTVALDDDNVEVAIKLPMLLRPLAGKIKQGLQEALAKNFAGQGGETQGHA